MSLGGLKIKILVTGATGNVGRELIKFLLEEEVEVYAADISKEIVKIRFGDKVQYRKLNFYDKKTFESCLKDIDKVFLMRPPQIGEVKKYMFPFIDLIKKKKIEHVVTLSIVDAMPFVPHYKIERYLEKMKIPYTHIRAGYFMQNLSTTHKDIIQKEKDLFIPAGEGKISFTDVRDIAEAAAKVLVSGSYKNLTLKITGKEALDYHQVAEKMTFILKQPIHYSNPSGRAFKKKMVSYGFEKPMIRIMRMIYSAVRNNKSDKVYPDFKKMLKKEPRTFDDFVKDYAECWK